MIRLAETILLVGLIAGTTWFTLAAVLSWRAL
jgi:hypothetical protein